jgi:hypothetical protein
MAADRCRPSWARRRDGLVIEPEVVMIRSNPIVGIGVSQVVPDCSFAPAAFRAHVARIEASASTVCWAEPAESVQASVCPHPQAHDSRPPAPKHAQANAPEGRRPCRRSPLRAQYSASLRRKPEGTRPGEPIADSALVAAAALPAGRQRGLDHYAATSGGRGSSPS